MHQEQAPFVTFDSLGIAESPHALDPAFTIEVGVKIHEEMSGNALNLLLQQCGKEVLIAVLQEPQ